MIELRQVKKCYVRAGASTSQKVNALHTIDLTIEGGEFLTITGPSGAGKTTLLNLIAGIERPDSGEIRVDGENLTHLSDKVLAKFRNKTIGYMLQFYCLPPHLNAEEQIMLPLLIGGKSITTAREKAHDLLEQLGIGALASAYPHEMSGGQGQRVALGRALANSPTLLLADEPTGNLDKKTAEQLIEVLIDWNLNRNTTTIVVTHDEDITRKAYRHLHMEEGVLTQKNRIKPDS